MFTYECCRRFVSVVDLAQLSRRGALPVLAALARKHPEGLGAMEFARASGVEPGTAGRVRDELVDLGLIEAKSLGEQGAVTKWEIRLTPLGSAVGPHVLAIEKALKGAGKRK